MQGDDPPYLSEGTAVSAKYKGAFCEAKVSKVVRLVKCKVTFKMGLGTATVHDDNVRGTLRVGQTVQAKHPERKEFLEATIAKVQDCSQYTVVFDDGDITTLKRTALCLKSGRHFNESETLDQLPLTHPEHFGNPVVGGRRGRRNRQLKEDSSEGEQEEDNEPDLELYTADIGRVVSVESSEKKRNKDNWFPGLIVMPSAQPTVKINMKDEFLVRSFKDGRYYTVPKKEVTEFTKELGAKVENSVLAEAVEKALKYLNEDSLPDHWEKSILFNPLNQYSDSEENFTDSSDDEPREEKDHFVAKLYKFMDDSGTPLNKSPTIGNKDVDLYRLFRIVHKLGGYNRVTNQNKWRVVSSRLKYANSQNTINQVKAVYKKCLYSYESFYRTLGCTMSDHTRSSGGGGASKKNRGRPLIRDKDRVMTPVQSPRPDAGVRDETTTPQESKEEKEAVLASSSREKKKSEGESSGCGDTIDQPDNPSSVPTPSTSSSSSSSSSVSTVKETAPKPKKVLPEVTAKEKKGKSEKAKPIEKKEEKQPEKESTRTKFPSLKAKEAMSPERRLKEKMPMRDAAARNMALKAIKKDERRGRKRINSEEKSTPESCTTVPETSSSGVNVGDKLMVYYGPTHDSKVVTYEAKVIEIGSDSTGPIYMVHYTGWNTRYDEWIPPHRIAENLSQGGKPKRIKQLASSKSTVYSSNASSSSSSTPTSKLPSKRGRGASFTGKASSSSLLSGVAPETTPRSTTPSSITSSSSRTKSPATPATRNRVVTRHGESSSRRTRRASVQTDVSVHSDSDSESSDCSDQIKTKDDSKTPKKRLVKTKSEKRKDDDDTEKEEESEKPKKPPRKVKRVAAEVVKAEEESDEEGSSRPKGRDFDLNQIRSELKGFTKIKSIAAAAENSEKDTASSDDSTTTSDMKVSVEEPEDKKEKIESPSSSEDVYEFKEPEPFEFESPKGVDDKHKKRFVPRVLEQTSDKSPKKKSPKAKDEDQRAKKLVVKEEPDPFDKLIESPSFSSGKPTEKLSDDKKIAKVLNMDLLFKELPLSIDESDDRLDISDVEETSEPLFSRKGQLFSDPEFAEKSDDRKTNTSDDEEIIKATMKNVLEFDNDSNDLISQPSEDDEVMNKDDSEGITLNRVESEDEMKTDIVIEKVGTQEKLASLSRQIAPVFQETDSALLRDLYSQQFGSKNDDGKDININYKMGTKVADSILQKLTKNKVEDISKEPEPKVVIEEVKVKDEDEDEDSEDTKLSEIKLKEKPKPGKSTKKAISKEFIEDSDSDSSDSEERLVMDEDSQMSSSLDNKDPKEADVSEAEMKFDFDSVEKDRPIGDEKPEEANLKEEDPDPDSLLYCTETLPGSPAPAPSNNEPKQKQLKVELEMPFASVPCSSGGGNGTSSGNKNQEKSNGNNSSNNKENVAAVPVEIPEIRDAAAVLDNTPPTTPESILSNLSPQRDNCDLSPNTADNDSCKSTEPEGESSNRQRKSSNSKTSPFSEEDTLMTTEQSSSGGGTLKKRPEETSAGPTTTTTTAGSCKKRRRSCKGSDDVPVKRGRKPNNSNGGGGGGNNRSRHNSDSDDSRSEHSAQGANAGSSGGADARLSRSPKPSKYNFCEPLDPTLDCSQRIAVLQQKLADVRKTYADIKAELATIERRRKRLRRREREAAKAAKQEATNT